MPLEHHKTSNCPVCLRKVSFRADVAHWEDDSPKWDEAFAKAGWVKMRGAYGRVVWVCSNTCAVARMSDAG